MASKKTAKAVKTKNVATTSTPQASATIEITRDEQQAMQEMIQLAKLEYLKALKNKVVKEKRREIDSLDQQIKEFLGAYMIIGYDLNNQPVEIVSADSPAAYDALLERFRRVMFKINQNIVSSNGEDPYGTSGPDT